jgi:hypothetical protein
MGATLYLAAQYEPGYQCELIPELIWLHCDRKQLGGQTATLLEPGKSALFVTRNSAALTKITKNRRVNPMTSNIRNMPGLTLLMRDNIIGQLKQPLQLLLDSCN